MALENKQKIKGTSASRLFVIVLVLLCLGFGGYTLYSLFTQTHTEEDAVKNAKIKVRSIDWDKTLFLRSDFRSLKNNLEAPVETGVVGNKQPFSKVTE